MTRTGSYARRCATRDAPLVPRLAINVVAVVLHNAERSRPVISQLSLTRVPDVSSTSGIRANAARLASLPGIAVVVLAGVSPFEIPLTRFGAGFTLTTLEVAVACALGVAAATLLVTRQQVAWRTPITGAAAACLAVLTMAALFAPADRGNALRFVGRAVAGAGIFVLVLNACAKRATARAFVSTLVAAGVVVSVIGILEVAQVRPVLQGLTAFRPGFHVVGGQLRATSTLFYPTIASMYLEVIFALGLWLLVDPQPDTRTRRAVVFAALTIVAAGITATFTRAGLVAVIGAVILAAAFHYLKSRTLDSTVGQLAALGLVITGLVVLSRSPDVLLARLRTEGSQDWYGATYLAPQTLRLRTGADYQIPVTLENDGRVAWDSSSEPMFAMSYHWLRENGESVVEFEGWRTPFPAPVEPGARITLPVNIQAPGEPGTYVLVWDVVHEHRAWLSTEGVTPARSLVHVEGERVSSAATTMSQLPRGTSRPNRRALWRAALQIAVDRPLTGVGPDNFRKVYGAYLGQTAWDTRVHANNMYLEILAGAGVFGLAALLWLVVSAGLALVHQWRSALAPEAGARAAFCAAWLVIAGHGLVDSFLSFTTTYVTFAIAAGLAFSPAIAMQESGRAHRV